MNDLISVIIPTKDRKEFLLRLVKSIEESTYKPKEIIIVNNGKKINLNKKEIKIINNGKNLGLAYARNKGAKAARGKYLLFIDDDNVVDPNMIKALVRVLDADKNIIAVGPATYYLSSPNKLWFIGMKYNFHTSIPYFFKHPVSERVKNRNLFLTDNLHNCFMVRKESGDKLDWFDEKIFMGGTELDFFLRAKKFFKNKAIVTNLDAKDFHDVPLRSKSLLRSLGFDNALRVFYFQRNRGLIIGRYGILLDKILLFFFIYPFFLLIYSMLFIINGKFNFFWNHLKGTVMGYLYLVMSF